MRARKYGSTWWRSKATIPAATAAAASNPTATHISHRFRKKNARTLAKPASQLTSIVAELCAGRVTGLWLRSG
jgi:hypothetical protein